MRLRKRLLALHAEAAAWFHNNLLKTPAAQEARNYLKTRDISVEIAKSWLLGYAPDSRDALMDFLREKHFSSEEIAQSGLAAAETKSGCPEAEVAKRRNCTPVFVDASCFRSATTMEK